MRPLRECREPSTLWCLVSTQECGEVKLVPICDRFGADVSNKT